jgi:hypothetical protein
MPFFGMLISKIRPDNGTVVAIILIALVTILRIIHINRGALNIVSGLILLSCIYNLIITMVVHCQM